MVAGGATRREQRRAAWVASGAPQVQDRLLAALEAVGVDLNVYTAMVANRAQPGDFQATIIVHGPDLDALIEALERAKPA